MNFTQAYELLKQGKSIKREAFPDKIVHKSTLLVAPQDAIATDWVEHNPTYEVELTEDELEIIVALTGRLQCCHTDLYSKLKKYLGRNTKYSVVNCKDPIVVSK